MPIRGGAIINIAGTTPVDDPEYRYKMPAVFGKIEGRGNGIKTVIPNIGDVAFSLHRDPAEVNKFFGCELGAQTKYTEQNSHAVINGAHTDGALQGLMHKYVEGFVICPTCGLPETEYKIKSEVIFHRCAACGSKHMLDMNHKLTTFILAQWKKKKKDKVKDKKKKDKDKEKGGTEKGSDEEDKDKDKDEQAAVVRGGSKDKTLEGPDQQKHEDPESAKLRQAVVSAHAALAHNLKRRVEIGIELQGLSGNYSMNASIDARVASLSNETQSPVLAEFLGDMWKEQRRYEIPPYTDALKKEEATLEKEAVALQAAYDSAKKALDTKSKEEAF